MADISLEIRVSEPKKKKKKKKRHYTKSRCMKKKLKKHPYKTTGRTSNQVKRIRKKADRWRRRGRKARNGSKEDKENKDDDKKSEEKDAIHGQGLIEFQKDLGVTDEEDPVILILAWKLRAETVWEFSKDEFMNGFWLLGCNSIDKIKSFVKEWKKDLKSKDNYFKSFYNFVFDYLKEDRTILLLDEAITSWNILLKDRKWDMFDKFIQFLKETGKKSITRDAWQQLWNFIISYPKDVKDYDPGSCWPILYDDFVEWLTDTSKSKSSKDEKKKKNE